MVDGGTTLDGMVGTSGGGSADFERNNGTAAGTSPRKQLKYTNTAGGAEKLMALQFFSPNDSLVMQGTTSQAVLDYSAEDGAGVGVDVKIAYLRVQGGLNTVPRPIVAAWNADGVDPTFDASISVVLAGGPVASPGGGAFATVVFAAGLPAIPSTDIFALALYTDVAVPPGGTLEMSNMVSAGPSGTVSRPNQPAGSLEDTRCNATVESSYPDGVDPGTAASPGGQLTFPGGGGADASVQYAVEKTFDPDAGPGENPSNGITLFSPVTGAAGMWWDVGAGADVAVVASNTSTKGFEVALGAALGPVQGHFLADAAL